MGEAEQQAGRACILKMTSTATSPLALSRELETVHSEIRSCTKCELHKSRTNAVPGDGPSNAVVMFVGEGPGQNEDKEGRPFVGAAGKLLTELLESVGLKRGEVFVTNIVKCRPPDNRPPRQSEIETCNPYLQSQIRLVSPRIICPLGTPAIKTLMGPEYSATSIHGKPLKKGQVVILPMYHPAAALYDGNLRQVLFEDMKILKGVLQGNIRLDKIPSMKIEEPQGERALHRWL